MTLPTTTGIGRIGKDPELSFTPSGAALLKFSVASSRSKKNDAGEWEDVMTSWLNITLWREEAQRMAEVLTRGMQIAYAGELHVRQYEKGDGTKGVSVDLEGAMVRPMQAAQSNNRPQSQTSQVTRSSTPAGGDDP